MKKINTKHGITLVALVITVVILLILVGVAIGTLGGENGLISKVNKAKKAQIEAEMKENLTLAITELQTEKEGKATLDDITQEWANSALQDYETKITTDPTINGKKIKMTKSSVTGNYIINENLSVTEIQKSSGSIEFSYEVKGRTDNKVKVSIHIQDKENGISKVEFPDGGIIECFGRTEYSKDNYEVEIGKEYKIKITSKNGDTKEETILISDYWYNITKNLGENVEIDNIAVKAAYNKPYEATLTTQGNYAITGLTVTMGGQAVTTSGNDIVDISTGKIYIEKVTEDIEITVTTKEIKIEYTVISVSTSSSASNTSSLGANTQTKGTILYINIIANVEGIACTATLKEDSTKAVPYAITRNGKYIFIVKGTYNGKTISEEKEIAVNKHHVARGLVQYDAGDWTESEIQSLQIAELYNLNVNKSASKDSGLDFTFGGFTYKRDTTNESYINNGTVITSRNQSVSCGGCNGVGKTPYDDGWRILEIKDSSGNVITNETEINSKLDNIKNEKLYVTKIVHAGCPENFLYWLIKSDDPYRVEYILSSGLRWLIYNTYNPRSCQMYVDKNQRDLIADTTDKDGNEIKDIHAMKYNEAYAITESNNSTTGIRNTGSYYWLGSAGGSISMWSVDKDGNIGYNMNLYLGVRPVVSMKSGVYIKSGDGTEELPYVLGIE